jgi:hypothetical protein
MTARASSKLRLIADNTGATWVLVRHPDLNRPRAWERGYYAGRIEVVETERGVALVPKVSPFLSDATTFESFEAAQELAATLRDKAPRWAAWAPMTRAFAAETEANN